jgi:hypothetical protein
MFWTRKARVADKGIQYVCAPFAKRVCRRLHYKERAQRSGVIHHQADCRAKWRAAGVKRSKRIFRCGVCNSYSLEVLILICRYKKITIRETLKTFEERLKTGFFRSHKSYLINIRQIDRVVNCSRSSYYEVYFKNYGEQALLSRDRLNDLNDLMDQFAR